MIIRNISITNFQSYYETQTLEFSKGLNLILGKGGYQVGAAAAKEVKENQNSLMPFIGFSSASYTFLT